MRTEPFEVKENAYDNDDIQYAFEYNGLRARLEDIESIVAEYPGENDGHSWYWILKMKDGTYSMAKGWCDYTGWDCQSGAEIADGFTSPELAVEFIEDDYQNRDHVRANLTKQLEGSQPFALIV